MDTNHQIIIEALCQAIAAKDVIITAKENDLQQRIHQNEELLNKSNDIEQELKLRIYTITNEKEAQLKKANTKEKELQLHIDDLQRQNKSQSVQEFDNQLTKALENEKGRVAQLEKIIKSRGEQFIRVLESKKLLRQRILTFLGENEILRQQNESLKKERLEILNQLKDFNRSMTPIAKLEVGLKEGLYGEWTSGHFSINETETEWELELDYDGNGYVILTLYNRNEKMVRVNAEFVVLGKTCKVEYEQIQAGGSSKRVELMPVNEFKEVVAEMESIKVGVEMVIYEC